MKIDEFFEREKLEEIWPFSVSRAFPRLGFKSSDVLTCSSTTKPRASDIVILVSDNCEPWPERFKDVGLELDRGVKVIGTALLLSRDLTDEGE